MFVLIIFKMASIHYYNSLVLDALGIYLIIYNT